MAQRRYSVSEVGAVCPGQTLGERTVTER